ncbi:MAG: HEAT repeat domain-containing protein [Pirellulaceae bacterium]
MLEALAEQPLEVVEGILRTILNDSESIVAANPHAIDAVLRVLQSSLLKKERREAEALDVDLIVALYETLPKAFPSRFLLLHSLSIGRGQEHLQALAELLVDDAPQSWIHVGLVLSPLFQHGDWSIEDIFPRLLDAIANPSVAGATLDLANHLYRSGRSTIHPCSDRDDELIPLLSALVSQLELVEKNPSAFGDSPEQINQILSEAIALIVSVCDALALIESDRAIPHLQAAMELSHRRIQTEAAGALARLGQQEGTDRLIALASEPSARLRVLAYAEELGLEDKIDSNFQSLEARAESELALWLAQPGQMAVPPSSLELLDHRLQFWPSFEEPIDCFLFRFTYRFAQGDFENVGMVGPLVHAFSADMTRLSIEDAYAAFAGWQAEHEDIYIVGRDAWNNTQQVAAESFRKDLEDRGFESVDAVFLGFFFGEHAVVANALSGTTVGVLVFDGLELLWFPTSQRPRPLGVEDAWHIFTGRKILRTFNSSRDEI